MKREYLMYKDLLESGLIDNHNNLSCQVIETPVLKRSKRRGYVYVLCGYFPGYEMPVKKIGISDNPLSRYMAICNRCPYPIFVDYLFYTPFYASIELYLHNRFKNSRIKNPYCTSGSTEWFVGVRDVDILGQFIESDFGQKSERVGSSNCGVFDYTEFFKPDIDRYFSNSINYTSLVSTIDMEVGSEEIPVLITSMDYLYK